MLEFSKQANLVVFYYCLVFLSIDLGKVTMIRHKRRAFGQIFCVIYSCHMMMNTLIQTFCYFIEFSIPPKTTDPEIQKQKDKYILDLQKSMLGVQLFITVFCIYPILRSLYKEEKSELAQLQNTCISKNIGKYETTNYTVIEEDLSVTQKTFDK